MSVKIMSKVWEYAPCRENSLIVLLALADWANDDGICWPSMQTLADKARIDRRSAQRIVRKLSRDGLVAIEEGGGRAKQHRYKVETAALCRPLESRQNSDIGDTERAALKTQRATLGTETATRVSPDPLVEPSEDTSDDPLRAPRDSDIRKWIPYLAEKKNRGQDVTLLIDSVESPSLRDTLRAWDRAA